MALIVLFFICCFLWALVCPVYDYEEGGEEAVGSISFEHLLFFKTIEGIAYPPAQNFFTGRWEGDKLFLTFQEGGQPEEASIVDDTIVFRGKTYKGKRRYFNVPFMPGT